MYSDFIEFVQSTYKTKEFIPLHEPRFIGNEKKFLNDCIDSTFVSSVGKYVDQCEQLLAERTGAKRAVAVMNGTAALHIALRAVGVRANTEVITQPLTFVATANAISYEKAFPVFVDVDANTLGMSAASLEEFLSNSVEVKQGEAFNKQTNRKIAACVPMHTFGHPCDIERIAELCEEYSIPLVEDAAEAIGSSYKGKALGTFGKLGVLSFNGNKVITSGGGGAVITDDEELANHIKYLTTTAKVPHKWDYVHDHIGFNYRMPNLNAALLVAQLEQLDGFLANKRSLAQKYNDFFKDSDITFITEKDNCKVNYWLNAIMLKDRAERDAFLAETNENGVMTRPCWELMSNLEMFKDSESTDISNAIDIANRLVNIPSSVTLN